MYGEGKNKDYKKGFNYESPRAKIELVKDIVAFANSGGGEIIFGHDEVQVIGIDEKTVQALDSARISDIVNPHIRPASIDLSHEVERVKPNKYKLTLRIPSTEFPLIMFKRGFWKGMDTKRDKPVFEKGDIWVRHSSKTEKITYEDLRQWINNLRESGRAQIIDRLTTFVNLPEGSDIQIVNAQGAPIDSPKQLLQNAVARRMRDPNHLLSGDDLLWLYQFRENFNLEDKEMGVVIGSALRRSPTLYWWLLIADSRTEIIQREILAALRASDRDKSDAAHNIAELAAIYLDDSNLKRVIASLKNSKYAHFKSEASKWEGRARMQEKIKARIDSSRLDEKPLLEYSIQDLESAASEISSELLKSKKPFLSRKLSSITRVLWAKQSRLSSFIEI